jgi:hypothetical protein
MTLRPMASRCQWQAQRRAVLRGRGRRGAGRQAGAPPPPPPPCQGLEGTGLVVVLVPCAGTCRDRSLEKYWRFSFKLSRSGPDKSKRIVDELVLTFCGGGGRAEGGRRPAQCPDGRRGPAPSPAPLVPARRGGAPRAPRWLTVRGHSRADDGAGRKAQSRSDGIAFSLR